MTAPRSPLLNSETKPIASNNQRFFTKIPSLQVLAITELLIQLGVEKVEEHLASSPILSFQGNIQITIKLIKNLHRLVEENNVLEADTFLNKTPMHLLPVVLKSKSTVVTSARGLNNSLTVRGTALMMALGAEAFGYNDQEGMVEMLKRHIKRAFPNEEGELEIATQTQKQFPGDWQQKRIEKFQKEYTFLYNLRKTIANSRYNSDEKLIKAFEEFKMQLEPKANEVIETGKYGRGDLLYHAFKMGYEEYFNDLRKDELYYTQVVGWIERLEPTNRKQEMAQGLDEIYNLNKKLKYSLAFTDSKGDFILPKSSTGIGFDSWVDPHFGRIRKTFLVGGLQGKALFKKMYTHKLQNSSTHMNAVIDFTKNEAQKKIAPKI